MPSFREFKAQRPNRILYETITFNHSTFGTIRLVANQVYPKTFAGQEYQPCRMSVVESQQSNTPLINSTVKFGRMAQDFKQKLKLWRGNSRLEPISCTYKRFDASDPNTPLKPWTLYVKSVSMDDMDVTVPVSIDNPINKNVATLFTTAEFPGLANA